MRQKRFAPKGFESVVVTGAPVPRTGLPTFSHTVSAERLFVA